MRPRRCCGVGGCGRPGCELPYLALNLNNAREPQLRKLFEITQLSVRLHDDTDHVTITIKLPADQLPQITHAAERIINTMPTTQEMPANTADAACGDAVRAPGGITKGWDLV